MPHLFLVLLLALSSQVSGQSGKNRLEVLRHSTSTDLKVVDPQFDSFNGRISFALRNDSRVPVEHVVLRFEGVYPDGRKTWWTFSEPIEGALTPSGERHRSKLLGPGESLQKSMGTPSKEGVELAEAHVLVQAVIYSDCSYQGEPEVADGIFRQRERLQLVRSVWIDKLSRISQQADDPAKLRQALHEALSETDLGAGVATNDRVSTQETEARAYAKEILGRKIERLLHQEDSNLGQRFELLVQSLEEEFEEWKGRVTHDVSGKRIR